MAHRRAGSMDRAAAAIPVGGALGGVVGALAGWFGSGDSADRWTGAATMAALGTTLGAAVGLAAGALPRASHPGPDDDDCRPDALLDASRAQVKRQWRVLLAGKRRLPAGFHDCPYVAPPRRFTGRLRHRSDLPAALDAARSPDGGPRLLVMGSPGHGKTVALVDIAHHLIDVHGDRFGVPVLLNLGSWGDDDHDLATWIGRELCSPAGLLPGQDQVAARWVREGKVAPVLDGLDEIPDPKRRRRCVAAINDFLDRAPERTALVVASRPDEYRSVTPHGADRLAVNAGIELQELRPELVVERLRAGSGGDSDSGVGDRLATLVGSDPTHPAVGLLRVPLWLWAAGKLGPAQAAALIRATTADEARRVLTDASLANSISALARDRRVSLDAAGCRRALAAIAGFLADPRSPDATTFRLENLTPPVPSLAQRRALWSAVSLAAAAIIGVLAHDLGWLDLWPDVPLLAIGLALLTMLRPDAGDTDALRRPGGGVQFRHALLAARLRQEAPDPSLMHLRQHLGATTDSSG